MANKKTETTITLCETCGIPVRVDFDEEGNIVKVYAFCKHVRRESEAAELEDDRP